MGSLRLSAGPATAPSKLSSVAAASTTSEEFTAGSEAEAAVLALLEEDLTLASFLIAGDLIPELLESLDGFILLTTVILFSSFAQDDTIQ